MPIALWTIGGLVAVFLAFNILQRFGKTPQSDLRFLVSAHRNKRDDGLADYQPRKAGDGRANPSGTNRPISAAEAHDIQITSANTWVPSQSRGERPKE